MEGIVSKREDRFQNPMLHQGSRYGTPTPGAGIKVGNARHAAELLIFTYEPILGLF